MSNNSNKMGFNATWSMAVGGMVGGGIFSVLGVIIDTAGEWAWLSFLIAGIIALISAHSYSQLSLKYEESGGAFTFLNKINHKGIAGSLSWVLVLGYILTVSVYAFTFGHYVAHVLNLGSWLPRTLAVLVIFAFTIINLRGVGDASKVEIITVWGKLIVLAGLSLFGIIEWNPEQLSQGVNNSSWISAVIGAAMIFMAYEGFQLLSYDYEDIKDPNHTLPNATISAVIAVIAVYILVSLGATMIVGAETLVEQKEVALSIAGQKAIGFTGLIIVTIAAAFSTGSAINATLFSTGRLMETVSKKNELPGIFAKENKSKIPYNSIIAIAGTAAFLSVIGTLDTLVDAASLVFLITFGVVNFIAFKQKIKFRYISLLGTLGSTAALVISFYEQLIQRPIPLISVIVLIAAIIILRPFILRKFR